MHVNIQFCSYLKVFCLLVVDGGNMGYYSSGNVSRNYSINAVYKSTVILSCHLNPNTKPIWSHSRLILYSKV